MMMMLQSKIIESMRIMKYFCRKKNRQFENKKKTNKIKWVAELVQIHVFG